MTRESKLFLLGTLAAGLFVFVTATLVINFTQLDFMSSGILIFAPIGAGAITLVFATDSQAASLRYRIIAPWGGIALWALVALVLAYETLVCIVMLAPLYGLLSSLGGLLVGWIRTNVCRRTSAGTAMSLAILPYLILPIEGDWGARTEFQTVKTHIEINAPKEVVWAGIIEVPRITDDERRWSFSHSIGIPKPVSACVDELEVGGVRDIRWEKGVHFEEAIIEVEPFRYLGYQVRVDPMSMAIRELDTHVVIGDQYFDVTQGSYTLKEIGETVHVELTTRYRISTKINPYGKLWADYVLDDFHKVVLDVIKQRIESGGSKSCPKKEVARVSL